MSDLCIIPARALRDETLTGSDIRVLCAIGIHTDGRTGEGCYAKAATLAEEAGVSVNQFWSSAKRLIVGGYLIRESGQAEGAASQYTIVLDRPRRGTPKTGVAVNPAQPKPGRESPESSGAPTMNAPLNATPPAPAIEVGKFSGKTVVAAAFVPDLQELQARIRSIGGSEYAWGAEMASTLDGMHGPARTPEEIGQAIRDFNASGAEVNLRYFRGFLRGNGSGSSPNGSSGTPGGEKSPSKPAWLVRKERDDRDEYLNKQPDVQAVVAKAIADNGGKNSAWYAGLVQRAQAADRWVAPFIYDHVTGAK